MHQYLLFFNAKIPANNIITNPTTPVSKEKIKMPIDEKNKNFPTFFGFLIKNGIIITDADQIPDIKPNPTKPK